MKKQSIMTKIFGHVPAVARGWILDKLSINLSSKCSSQNVLPSKRALPLVVFIQKSAISPPPKSAILQVLTLKCLHVLQGESIKRQNGFEYFEYLHVFMNFGLGLP